MTVDTTKRTSRQNDRYRALLRALDGEPNAIDALSQLRTLQTVPMPSCNGRQSIWSGTDGGDGLLYASLTLFPRAIVPSKYFCWVTDLGASPSLGKISFGFYDLQGNLVAGTTSEVDPVSQEGVFVLEPEFGDKVDPGLYYFAVSTNISQMRILKTRNGWTGSGPAVGVVVAQPWATEPETGLPETIPLNNKSNLRMWLGAVE